MELYHGSTVTVKTPEIRIEKYNKGISISDFTVRLSKNKRLGGQDDSEKESLMSMNILLQIH